MKFNRVYKALEKNSFSHEGYTIVPIRYEDRYNILKWRNEQIYHLRQSKPLTKEEQDRYFNEIVRNLFEEERPCQMLFSYLKDEECIGYGGLVHINWADKNSEISFIMDTQLEKDEFEKHWSNYLKLIEEVAFQELKLHKLHTYAFDLRPKIYKVLENAGFTKEAVLREHCLYNQKFIDVIIHSKFNKNE